jgi:hypothetical protein
VVIMPPGYQQTVTAPYRVVLRARGRQNTMSLRVE